MTTSMDELVAPPLAEMDWKQQAPPVFIPDETDYVERRSPAAANLTGHLPRLQSLIGQICEHDEVTFDLQGPVRPDDKFADLIGRSASLRAILDDVKMLAPTVSTVPILEE